MRITDYEKIEKIIREHDKLSDKDIKLLLKDIDFDESDIYEELAENDMSAEDIMSVPQLAKMVNHYAIWIHLPISFTIDKDTTLEEFEDYIDNALGLVIEDYLIQEVYDCIMDSFKNN